MAADNTIRQQASDLVDTHGEDAPIQAANRAQALLDQGDLAGSDLWGRIGNLTNVLLSKTSYSTNMNPSSGDSPEPEGSVAQDPTLDDLPSPDIKRWRFQHKALVVNAVRTGLIDVAEACSRYSITIEEFLSWKRLLDEHGMYGLRATRLQEYRRPPSKTSRKNRHSPLIRPHGGGS